MEQHDALLEHSIPGVASGKLQILMLAGEPFPKEHIRRVFMPKIGAEGKFKSAAKEHRGAGVLFAPTVQIPMSVPSRAG
jgi:hypothetical protein